MLFFVLAVYLPCSTEHAHTNTLQQARKQSGKKKSVQGSHLEYITFYMCPDIFLYPFYIPANSSLIKKSKSKEEHSHHFQVYPRCIFFLAFLAKEYSFFPFLKIHFH